MVVHTINLKGCPVALNQTTARPRDMAVVVK